MRNRMNEEKNEWKNSMWINAFQLKSETLWVWRAFFDILPLVFFNFSRCLQICLQLQWINDNTLNISNVPKVFENVFKLKIWLHVKCFRRLNVHSIFSSWIICPVFNVHISSTLFGNFVSFWFHPNLYAPQVFTKNCIYLKILHSAKTVWPIRKMNTKKLMKILCLIEIVWIRIEYLNVFFIEYFVSHTI